MGLLRVTARGNMPEPEGLQAVLVEDVEQVFSVRGDSGQGDVAAVGEILDGHCFDRQSTLVGQKGVDAEAGGGQQEKHSR